MKKILFAMASLSALAFAAPAMAQYSNQGPYPAPRAYPGQRYADDNIEARIERLRVRLDAGVRQGTITPREAWPLRLQLRDLTRIERQYRRDGLDRRETADLQLRLRSLGERIRLADGRGYDRYDRNADGADDRYDRNRDGYDDRYDRNRDGYDDRYDRNRDRRDDRFDRNADGRDDRYDRNADGRDDRYDRNNDGVDDRYDRNEDGWDDRDANRDGRWDVESRYDSNRDGWDDRDIDRDGRWDDDVADGRYRDDGNAGLIGSVAAGLTVGQRAPVNLLAVPAEYRGQYRDGNGAYYRSDGRAIYQIDARTDTVVRIYPMSR
jgi:hypothetical protein